MKRLQIIGFALLFLLVGPRAGFADAAGGPRLEIRAFQLKFKQAERAAVVIKPMLSPEGSLSIQAGTNTLAVTDRPENLRQITTAIEKFDVTGGSFRLEIRLVAASRTATPGKVADDLREISTKLSGVLRFNTFEKLGEVVSDAKEGSGAVIELSPEYRAELRVGEYDRASDTVRITELRLSRLEGAGKEGQGQLAQLLKTSLNLKVGQTVIVGASRSPDSQKALMLVLAAKKSE